MNLPNSIHTVVQAVPYADKSRFMLPTSNLSFSALLRNISSVSTADEEISIFHTTTV